MSSALLPVSKCVTKSRVELFLTAKVKVACFDIHVGELKEVSEVTTRNFNHCGKDNLSFVLPMLSLDSSQVKLITGVYI